MLHMLHADESPKHVARWLSMEQRTHFGMTPDPVADRDLAIELVASWHTGSWGSASGLGPHDDRGCVVQKYDRGLEVIVKSESHI